MTVPAGEAVWRATRIVGLTTPFLLLAMCRSQSGRASPEECAPVSAELTPASSAEGLAGEYRLRLVATSGAKKGAVVDGTLWLQRHDSSLRYRPRLGGGVDSAVVHPLYGTMDIDLDSVDAVSVGDVQSRDPLQPGVLVIERHAAPGKAPPAEITMRLGSDANRRDRQRFDGGYTALRVRQVSAAGFTGTWGSGVTGERSAGYFCATRTDGR